MSVFDRHDAGTPASAWQLDGLPRLPVPYPGDRVVVLAAHPDDETLGAGGLICSLARRGVDLTVIFATSGEASHPDSSTHNPAELAAIRRSEAAAALAVLAPGLRAHFLGLGDGRLDSQEAALAAEVGRLARHATHLISPWSHDRHPDHESCGRAAASIAAQVGARHWQYPIWAWHWADPAADELSRAQLRCSPVEADDLARKQAALACYRSQHTTLSDQPGDEAVLSPDMLAHFAGNDEYFLLAGADATSPASFDALYARTPDPWHLQNSYYEQRKRDIVMAALPRRRFRRAFEPGCATGLLTERLAARCDEVNAWDVTESALTQARARVGSDAVRLEQRRIPEDWPDGEFDLVALSEVGYYCEDLPLLVRRINASLAADGVLLACHWRRPAPDHPYTAEAVHIALDGTGLHPLVRHVEADFLLQVWTRTARSVAQREAIVP